MLLVFDFNGNDFEYEIKNEDAYKCIADYLAEEYDMKGFEEKLAKMIENEDIDLSAYDEMLEEEFYEEAKDAWRDCGTSLGDLENYYWSNRG